MDKSDVNLGGLQNLKTMINFLFFDSLISTISQFVCWVEQFDQLDPISYAFYRLNSYQ